ncbi:hypothetical protein N665_0598s0016 [Sinapis alba]|nr:hypothetical protein N665_0598s0016 [Sinapis alba]
MPPNERRTVETKEPVVVNAEPETIVVAEPVEANVEKEVVEPVEVNVEKETVEVVVDTPPLVRVYTPKLPYPGKQKKSRRDLEGAKCKELVGELTVKLSFEDAVEMMPALKRYVKSLMTNKASPKESVMSISKSCSTLLQNRVPEKMEDPRSFVLSCEIEGAIFRRSLCDLGSSVNLIPYTMAKRIGFANFKPTKIQLVFADRLDEEGLVAIATRYFRQIFESSNPEEINEALANVFMTITESINADLTASVTE